jgi:hypothetical protein
MNLNSWKIELVNHRCGSYKGWDMLGILEFEITSPTGHCQPKCIGFWRLFIDHKFQGSIWEKIFEQHVDQFVKWGIAIIERLIDSKRLDEEVLIHTTYNHNLLGKQFGEILMRGDIIPTSTLLTEGIYEYTPSE